MMLRSFTTSDAGITVFSIPFVFLSLQTAESCLPHSLLALVLHDINDVVGADLRVDGGYTLT